MKVLMGSNSSGVCIPHFLFFCIHKYVVRIPTTQYTLLSIEYTLIFHTHPTLQYKTILCKIMIQLFVTCLQHSFFFHISQLGSWIQDSLHFSIPYSNMMYSHHPTCQYISLIHSNHYNKIISNQYIPIIYCTHWCSIHPSIPCTTTVFHSLLYSTDVFYRTFQYSVELSVICALEHPILVRILRTSLFLTPLYFFLLTCLDEVARCSITDAPL